MKIKRTGSPCVPIIALIGFVVISGCSRESGKESPAAPASAEIIATTRQVMLGLTIPASDVVFQVGSVAPKDDVEWEKVQANAAMLAESANLLLTAPRLVDAPEWKDFAKSLVATSKVALQAAQAHDVEKVLDAGNQIYEVCDGCHKKYLPARAGE